MLQCIRSSAALRRELREGSREFRGCSRDEEPWGAARVLREGSWEPRGTSERALGGTEGAPRVFLLVFGAPEGAKVSFEGLLGTPEEPWGAPRGLREGSWELEGPLRGLLGAPRGLRACFCWVLGLPGGAGSEKYGFTSVRAWFRGELRGSGTQPDLSRLKLESASFARKMGLDLLY